MKVIKRDGSQVEFDSSKIVRAVRLSATRTQKVLSKNEEYYIVQKTIEDLAKRGLEDMVKVEVLSL